MTVAISDLAACQRIIKSELAARHFSNRITAYSNGIGGTVMVTIHDWQPGPHDENFPTLQQLFRVAANHGFRIQAV